VEQVGPANPFIHSHIPFSRQMPLLAQDRFPLPLQPTTLKDKL
jgi:hypothetical protein